jgi:hypothetical protein
MKRPMSRAEKVALVAIIVVAALVAWVLRWAA